MIRKIIDDLSSVEDKPEDEKEPVGRQDKGTSSFPRWLAFIVFLIFLLTYLPFRNHPWGWFVAIAVS